MVFIRVIPFVVACFLLGAHFLRQGSLLLTGACLLAPFLLLIKKRWAEYKGLPQQLDLPSREGVAPDDTLTRRSYAPGPDDQNLRIVEREIRPGGSDTAGYSYAVAGNAAEIEPELVRRGLAREVVRLVQETRKSAGLDVSDRIVLWLATESDELAAALGIGVADRLELRSV